MINELFCPSLEDLTIVFQDYLKSCFSTVKCKVVDCPDLSTSEYGLASKGLRGTETLCDIGSFDYFLPTPMKEKRYDAMDAFHSCSVTNGILMGAAAGPHFLTGLNSELVANLSCHDSKIEKNKSYCGFYDEENKLPVSALATTSQFAMVAQMYLCEGKPGQVLEITAKGRTREGKFDALLREALTAKYSSMDRPVGLGGVVVQDTGTCLFHVLPEFCSHPLNTPEKLKDWLKFFHMEAPVVSVGTVLSHDPKNWKIRLEHFHCFNTDRSKCGHSHFDSDGPTASYRAYLVPGKQLLRVDPPT